jgi:hypothetical protein
MPLCPRVRPTAILKDFSWLCLRFHRQRPIALERGLQFKINSAPQFAARWVPEANLCGNFFPFVVLFVFVVVIHLVHRFTSSMLDLTFYWRIHCDDMGRVRQSARLVPNILNIGLSK